MSHYDCNNCGYYLGVGYGYCEYCTPKSYLIYIKNKNNKLIKNIPKEIANSIYNYENYDEYSKALKEYNLNKPTNTQPLPILTKEELLEQKYKLIEYHLVKEVRETTEKYKSLLKK